MARLGSFLSGLNDGINTGLKLSELIKQKGINDTRRQAMQDAEAARQADINSSISVVNPNATNEFSVNNDYQKSFGSESNQPEMINPAINGITQAPYASKSAQPGQQEQAPNLISPDIASMTNSQMPSASSERQAIATPQDVARNGLGMVSANPGSFKFRVAGTDYDTRDAAQKAAEKGAKSKDYYFHEKVAPAVYDAYMKNGDIDKADEWQRFADSRRGKSAMKEWADGYTKLLTNDLNGAASQFGRYYTQYIDDGVDYVGHKEQTDQDGNITGFLLNLRDKNGKTAEVPFNKEQLLQFAQVYNPQMVFEDARNKQKAADERKIKLTDEMAKENRQELRETKKDQRKQEYTLQTLPIKSKLQADKQVYVDNYKTKNNIQENEAKADRKDMSIGEKGKMVRDLRNAGIPESVIQTSIAGSRGGKAPDPTKIRLQLHESLMKNPKYSRLNTQDQEKILAEQVNMITRSTSNSQSQAQPASGGVPILGRDGKIIR